MLLKELEKYPTLKALFGKDWFARNLFEKEKNRYLLTELLLVEEPEDREIEELSEKMKHFLMQGRLSDFISVDSKISRLLYSVGILKHLDMYFERLRGIKGLGKLVEKIATQREPDQFMCALTQAEITSKLIENFGEIELEKQVGEYKADLEARSQQTGRNILFSIIIPNTVDEFMKNRMPLLKKIMPLVPIIDISLSKRPYRKLKSLYDSKEISAIIAYNRIIYHGECRFIGFLIENPETKNRLVKNEIDVLCNSLNLIRFPIFNLIKPFLKKNFQKKFDKVMRKGGYYAVMDFFKENFARYVGEWIKSPKDMAVLFLHIIDLLRRKSDRYEYRCFTFSFLLHLSALTVNSENWWREFMRLRDSLSFLQDSIAQIQNLEMTLLSKRKSSEEIKISLLLPLYVNTLEGLFQGMARVVAMEINLILGKSSKNITEMGIPKLVKKINSFGAGELKVLAKGYSQVLRNAFSHGTFKIDHQKKIVIARDREKEEIFSFAEIRKLKNRLEQASYMVGFSLVLIMLRLATMRSQSNV